MASKLPVVVSGLGRCGTSMVMQMLVVGGLKPTGRADWPLVEDSRVMHLSEDSEWLKDLDGQHVIKLAMLHRACVPDWFRCKAIWMERDLGEQVKSFRKIRGVLRPDEPFDIEDDEEFKRVLWKNTDIALRILRKISPSGVLRVRFENVLKSPLGAAKALRHFLCKDLDTDRMVKAVIPREPRCLDVVLEKVIGKFSYPR